MALRDVFAISNALRELKRLDSVIEALRDIGTRELQEQRVNTNLVTLLK
jgi:hypothetical protein